MPVLTRREIVQTLLERDGELCKHPDCLLPFTLVDPPTVDHWFPQCHGGTWDLENLKLMHKKCNTAKGDKIPFADGTLPESKKKVPISRAVKRGERPVICESCHSGRLLGPDEECSQCGSGPMPPNYPMWSKVKPNECTHSGIWWCWACMSGIVTRAPASKYVFGGGEPGID